MNQITIRFGSQRSKPNDHFNLVERFELSVQDSSQGEVGGSNDKPTCRESICGSSDPGSFPMLRLWLRMGSRLYYPR